MSKTNCPYCKIKSVASGEILFKAENPKDGQCPDCEAWIDCGQYSVKVNSYHDIYCGALKLIGDVLDRFAGILEYYDIDLDEYADSEGIVFDAYTSEIIDRLFVPYMGGTTKCNLQKAIGIKEDVVQWKYEDGEFNRQYD